MRTLPNLAGQRVFSPSVQLSVIAADVGTTWVFSRDQIVGLGSIVWECDFLGGLARTAAYNVGIAAPLTDIKDMLRDNGIVKGTTTLRVDVGSSTFYPHVGIVRGSNRERAQELQLVIADRALDQNPLLPSVALTDSWATPHLEHLTDGEHWFYGAQILPTYMSAVDCAGGIFLGPRNVTSGQRAGGMYFMDGKTPDLNDIGVLTVNASWSQQSGSTNVATPALPFEIIDNSVLKTRFWKYEGNFRTVGDELDNSGITAHVGGYLAGNASHTINFTPQTFPQVSATVQAKILQATRFNYAIGFTGGLGVTLETGAIAVGSGSGFLNEILSTASGAAVQVGSLNISSNNGRFLFMNPGAGQYIQLSNPFSAGKVTYAFSLQFGIRLAAEAYKKFHVFVTQVTCNELAISVNPFAILDHVHSWQTSIPYRQDQSSTAQVAAQSYQFCGYLGPERAPWSNLVHEFGQITGTYAWLGDSGMLNYRAYANSGTVTVNASLSMNDYLSFRLTEAPIGSSTYEAEQLRKITGRWGYRHYDGKFAQSYVRVNSSNGVRNEAEFQTKWIQDTVTASLWLNTLYARYNAGRLIAEFEVGPEHVDIELADVLWLEHPLVIGSASLFQVKRAEMNLRTLAQKLTAVELVAR